MIQVYRVTITVPDNHPDNKDGFALRRQFIIGQPVIDIIRDKVEAKGYEFSWAIDHIMTPTEIMNEIAKEFER